MTVWKRRSKLKASGGKYWPDRKKKGRELGPDPIMPTIGAKIKTFVKRIRGGDQTKILRVTNYANVALGNGQFKKVELKTVKENPANRHFVRMNALTKGAVVDTSAGLIKITSKPAKHGIVNAVLVKK